MISEEEKLIATLATQLYVHRKYISMDFDDAVIMAKNIIEKSRLTDKTAMPTSKPRKVQRSLETLLIFNE